MPRRVRLRYTPRALIELDRIFDRLHTEAPTGARNVQRQLQSVVRLLRSNPEAGTATESEPVRRISVRPYPYVVFYRYSDEEVVIFAVRHAARDPRTMPGGNGK